MRAESLTNPARPRITDTCSSYVAKDQSCTSRRQCFTCRPTRGPDGPLPGGGCAPMYDHGRLVASAVGGVAGQLDMKAEIWRRGPISCAIEATQELDAHRGAYAQGG
jgi:cathepsin X